MNLKYNNIIDEVMMAYRGNRLFFVAKKTSYNIRILKVLKSQGIVMSFYLCKVDDADSIKVFLKYVNLEIPFLLPCKHYFKGGYKLNISLKKLSRISDSLGGTSLILSTNLGLLTHKECLERKVGGKLYLIIYGV